MIKNYKLRSGIEIPTYRCKRCYFLYIDEQQDKPFEQIDEFKYPSCKCSKKMFGKLLNS